MSQLLQTFKFKKLSLDLTNDEFDEFLSTLHRSKGREFFLRLLCQQQEQSIITDMHQITSKIINKRDNHTEESIHRSLDTLPKSIIGEIGSNLKEGDYAAFSRVSRAIYIGCNDPNRLRSACWFSKSGEFNLTQYPLIEMLKIHLIGSSRLPRSDRPIFGHLKSLSLQHFDENENWNSILQQTVNLSQLKHLSLHACTFTSREIMRSFFRKFNMIQHLDLWNVPSAPRTIMDTPWGELRNLKSLRMADYPLARSILRHYGSQLEQLDLYLSAPPYDDLISIKFTKLQKLHIEHTLASEIKNHIIESAPNITSICCLFGRQSNSIDAFLTKILKKKKLTHLHVIAANRLEPKTMASVCQAIEYGLQSTRKLKREKMMIGLQTGNNVDINSMAVHISSILTRLQLCNIDEFALFYQVLAPYFSNCLDVELMNQEMKDLVEGLGNVELVRSERSVFIVRSKGSRINSYKMWWNEFSGVSKFIY